MLVQYTQFSSAAPFGGDFGGCGVLAVKRLNPFLKNRRISANDALYKSAA